MHGIVILRFIRTASRLFLRYWPLVAVIMLCIAWGVLGFKAGKWRGDALLERTKSEHVRNIERVRAEAREIFNQQREEADLAIIMANRRAEAAEQIAEVQRHAINEHVDGRDCLSPDARGVLHRSPAFGMPGDSGSFAGAYSAFAADSSDRYTTDADIAGWAVNAAERYEGCRARIDSLRDWSKKSGR